MNEPIPSASTSRPIQQHSRSNSLASRLASRTTTSTNQPMTTPMTKAISAGPSIAYPPKNSLDTIRNRFGLTSATTHNLSKRDSQQKRFSFTDSEPTTNSPIYSASSLMSNNLERTSSNGSSVTSSYQTNRRRPLSLLEPSSLNFRNGMAFDNQTAYHTQLDPVDESSM
ncbi:hypothetical protein CROQUDRAFT_622706 [Cronartium quercuum f. sp. fusiforme G11]|uniref:Uncharacterized protein n=1 Tax=Cronartium quercuum f. sp. fusiforme G11 TaxID=708437 RepID=A0A9P6T9R0_9BASI|nr:hypothetical protein CROQUDRAFT_622706 [Cronartium quercuum f. sp. fusiforme G11]